MALPESYRDPAYDRADAASEQKLGLPVGLLSSIRTHGEKSNASQVSDANATTPYQFIPATRKAILDKFGIDVTLSPENASEGAGLLLRDSLKRNAGDQSAAISEYIGGTNRDNWGPQTRAYTGRVMMGQQRAKLSAMGEGFAKFMAANPAAPERATQPESTAPAQDPMSAGFGNWLASQRPYADRPLSEQIPEDVPGQRAQIKQQQAQAAMQEAAKPDPSLVDQIIGAGEAGLTLATGATGGALGMAGGALGGIAGSIATGQFGTQEGVRNVERAASEGAQALTYQPRTEVGQQRARQLGEGMAAILPALPLTAELGAVGRSIVPVAQAAKDINAAGVARIRMMAPAIAERVERTLRRTPDATTPTPGTRGSGGSAATDMADQRRAAAQELGIPITEGQMTRNESQLRFEKETAKGEQGQAFRDRYSEQNELFGKKFDDFIDQTGAEAPTRRAAGKVVDEALVKQAARDKNAVRVGYKEAEKAGELDQPVTLTSLVDHLNESAPDAATAPLLNTARARAIQLGIAAEGEGGTLTALPTTLKNAERYRQAIGRATDYEATNMRQSAIIKGNIDSATDGMGGGLYKAARRLRENFAKKYEDRSVVSSLLTRKRGTDDRKVALADVFEHTILGGRDEAAFARRVLQGGGGAEGAQAWRELQGQGIQWLKDKAFSNNATDQRGNVIFSSPKLDKAIAQLDKDGTLELLYGKKGASTLRDLNELGKVVFTTPPGVVNTSNTASVLMAALAEAGVTGSMTGLPVPVISGLRLIAKQVANRKLRARIEQSLNAPQRRRQAPPQP